MKWIFVQFLKNPIRFSIQNQMILERRLCALWMNSILLNTICVSLSACVCVFCECVCECVWMFPMKFWLCCQNEKLNTCAIDNSAQFNCSSCSVATRFYAINWNILHWYCAANTNALPIQSHIPHIVFGRHDKRMISISNQHRHFINIYSSCTSWRIQSCTVHHITSWQW